MRANNRNHHYPNHFLLHCLEHKISADESFKFFSTRGKWQNIGFNTNSPPGSVLSLAVPPPWVSTKLEETDHYRRRPRVQHGHAQAFQVSKIHLASIHRLQFFWFFKTCIIYFSDEIIFQATSRSLAQVKFCPVESASLHFTSVSSKSTGWLPQE